jgi:hypothetical protein
LRKLFLASVDNASMRIKGPTDGAPPVPGVEAPDQVGQVTQTEAASSVSPTTPVAPSGPAGSIDPIGRVAAELRAGQITIDQAVERLIDDAVERHLGQAKDLERELRELLRSYAESDPFLVARIRRLTLAK